MGVEHRRGKSIRRFLLDVYEYSLPSEYTGLRGRPFAARWRTLYEP